MDRSRLSSLAFVFAGIVFFVVALFPRTPGQRVNTTFLVLGIVFLILALARFRRGAPTPPARTDPRLPARKVDQKRDK